MKSSIIPTSHPANLKRQKFLRNTVYHHRPSSLPRKYKDVQSPINLYHIVAGGDGFLQINHFNSLSRIILRGMRHTQYGERKNMMSFCHIHPKVIPLSLTKKANGIRMGKGKGGVDRWLYPVRKGQILYTIKRGVNPQVLGKLFHRLRYKLPFPVVVISYVGDGNGGVGRYELRGGNISY